MFNTTVTNQRDFFSKSTTIPLSWRIEQLKALKATIKRYESEIITALKADLNRPAMETYASEIGFIYDEINFLIKNLPIWIKPQPVSTPWFYSGAKSFTLWEPYGIALIISPWNYPFLLTLLPLAGAIAAGNCAIVKPSEYSINSTEVIKKIISSTFSKDFISYVSGGIPETQQLLSENFDIIFFTGSSTGGQAVAQAAAKKLTPVILELGGKNPCIVCKDADITVSARKIAWAKFINAGQTCVAPDYVLVHNSVKEKLIHQLKNATEQFFGRDPQKSRDYCRIINDNHFLRLKALLTHGHIVHGGQHDKDSRYISPTIIDEVFSTESQIMREEIFGPILPIIGFEDIRRAATIVATRPKPLAVYLFTEDKEQQEYITHKTSSGGLCINDCMLQSSTQFLPFGGVGASGMGRCHGKASYLAFSNTKSILKSSSKADMKFRYPPYKKLTYFILRLLMR